MHVRLFNIIYSTTFSFLSLVLLILILVTPADSIRQAFNNQHFYNLAAIAGTYLLTAVLALLIYSSRLYTNRSVLAAIPKAWVPIDKGDVGSSVGKMIEEGLCRSAVVARDARPRDLRSEREEDRGGERRERSGSGGSASAVRDEGGVLGVSLRDHQRTDHERQEAATAVTVPPVWGHIAHPGHSSPSSSDLPNLHYLTVILELPHLIEAKAVSLAPPSPSQTPTNTTHPPSTRALSLLQRPAEIGLREYIHHLTGLGLIQPPGLAEDFLVRYERARFSGVELTEEEFRALVGVFAEVLGGMVVGAGLEGRLREEADGDGTRSFVSGTTMPSSSSGRSFESFVPSSVEQDSLGAASLRLPRQRPMREHPSTTTSTTPPRPISSQSLGGFGLSSFFASSSSFSVINNNSNRGGTQLAAPQHPQEQQLRGDSSTDLSSPGDDATADNNPLHQSMTWETVQTPGGGLWVGPPPLEWQRGSGGPFG
ncbi:hypothetical protein FGG08_006385 [Glutinoglossum americanum]|uniref:Defect at low temperature protein 1 n=1 Tax=Glutinoglossum americanum TaxID=1670608 RepID=A0A9P8HW72_9PEZI|nr:hypothetical protein FGG08_006385 [Glutinoglossum americanum]